MKSTSRITVCEVIRWLCSPATHSDSRDIPQRTDEVHAKVNLFAVSAAV